MRDGALFLLRCHVTRGDAMAEGEKSVVAAAGVRMSLIE